MVKIILSRWKKIFFWNIFEVFKPSLEQKYKSGNFVFFRFSTRIHRRASNNPIRPSAKFERKHFWEQRRRSFEAQLASELDISPGQETLLGRRERDGNGSRHLDPNDGPELQRRAEDDRGGGRPLVVHKRTSNFRQSNLLLKNENCRFLKMKCHSTV